MFHVSVCVCVCFCAHWSMLKICILSPSSMPLVLQGWKCQTAKIYATTYCTLLEWQQVFLFYLSKKSFIIACFKFITPDCGREKEGMETEPQLWDIVIFQDIGVLFTTHRLGRGKKGKRDHFTLILDHFQRALLCQDGQEIVSFSSFFSSFFRKRITSW